MSTESDDPHDPDDLAEVERRMEHLRERVREKRLAEGAAITEERTLRAGREALRQILAAEKEPEKHARARWVGVGLAAAAAVLLVFWMTSRREPERDRLPLGPDAVRLVHPTGEVAQFDRFEWVGELPPGGSFLLILRDAARPDAEPVVREELHEPRWIPSAEVLSRLPRELDWEVQILDALGHPRGSNLKRAVRASRD